MAERIPLIDLSIQHREIRAEVDAAFKTSIDANAFILGPQVKGFEAEAAAYVGRKHAVGLANGTDALLLALRALKIGPGDEVILPAFTFVSTAEVVVHAGATPVYADVDPDTFCLGEVKPTSKTKAVIPVDLFGHPADWSRLSRLGIPLVEDGAQSFGASLDGRKALAFGAISCTSFYPTKNLGGWGDGGMCFTDDDALARELRVLGNHGWEQRYHPFRVGYNSRLDELQAAVLRAKLRRLDAWTEQRIAAAKRYDGLLKGVVGTPKVAAGARHAYHLYMIRSPKRDAIAKALSKESIDSGVYYPNTIPSTEAFRKPGAWPVSEALARELLAIPMFPGLTPAQQDRVAAVIRSAV